MKNSIVFIFYSISLCMADNFFCQVYDQSGKSFEYYCDDFIDKLPENCSKEQFAIGSTEIRRLKIGGCDLNTVAYAVASSPNLLELDISHSGYFTLNALDIRHPQLERLNVSHNRLSEIPPRFLQRFPKLIEVDFGDNSLESIYYFPFEAAKELKRINLAFNFIDNISHRDFEGLTNLEHVDLRNNRILYGFDAFRNHNSLKTLHFEMNSVLNFNCNDFFANNSYSVFIDWGFIETFVFKDCAENRFDVVLNSERTGILAQSNGHFEIHCKQQSFINLLLFDAVNSNIENIAELLLCFGRSLVEIYISDAISGEFDAKTFENFDNLKELSLKNTKLEEFDFGVLKHLKKLKKLSISNNNFKRLANIPMLERIGRLIEFSAIDNQLEIIPEILNHLALTIKSLDLSGNFVGKLNLTSLLWYVDLETLILSNTSLSISNFDPFEHSGKLKILDISRNNLEAVDFTVLSPTLSRLHDLNAADCRIQNASKVIELLGPSLRVLDLSGNFVGDLNEDLFKKLKNLHFLYLSNANISHFNSNALVQQTALEELNISYNELRKLDARSLSRHLTWLYLEGNELIEMKHLDRQRFSMLESLDISKNQLSCASLERIANEWSGKFIGDPWDQKHGEHCRK